MSRDVLYKMNPKQVAALLKSHGASDKSVAFFLDNDVSGKTIVDGLSDEDLKVSYSIGSNNYE